MLAALSRAIVAFGATNIDDIFVLTFFFSQKNVKRTHVILGQYLGIAALVSISLVGYVARLPENWIALLGLAPIAIGIKKLIELNRGRKEVPEKYGASSVFTVAIVTFANGGDNIAVYLPLFANSNASAVIVTLVIFALMIAVWCLAGYYIGNHSFVNRTVDRYGHALVPFVLIDLGIYILARV